MSQNVTQKIIADHLSDGKMEPGDEISLKVDQVLLQDATGTMACMQLEQLGTKRLQIPFGIVYVDHNILALDFKNPDDHIFLRTFCAKYGIHYSRPGNGICHYLHLERFSRPGQVLIGADSHTTMAGALSMLAMGAGGLDVAVVMAGHSFVLTMPKVVGVRLIGKLQPWVEAKDVILELLQRRGVRGGLGRIFEFYGEGVATLNATQRGTICNMIAELGATTGIFPSDDRTREWLVYQNRGEQFLSLEADPDAEYDEEEVIDLGELEPLIAKPHSPGNVVAVREVAGTPVRQVCVGSSVNSGYEDLAIVGEALKGKGVHSDVSLTVTPGSRQILDTIVKTGAYDALLEAGARMLEPACGPCVGMGQAPPSGAASVRTMNRNFPGRSGTADDQVYLCSPSTAAATALKGVITDPRDLGPMPTLPPPPTNPSIDDRQILVPPPPEIAHSVEVIRGPNIRPPLSQSPLPQSLLGKVLLILGDDISTGDLAPDGAIVMAFRSNVEAIAEFTLQRIDVNFPSRAKEWGGGFIVAGQNYGQGSSREHAALGPKALGVQAIIAKSYARIHRRNLISQGVPPLTFAHEEDWRLAQIGDNWEIPNIRQALEQGLAEIKAHSRNTGKEILFLANFTPREAEVLLAGGLIACLKGGGQPLTAGHVQSGAEDQGSLITNPTPQEQIR
ncbi:MAG: aconitate hydratase [Chloroflexi bacterium]|nr:aconitate hydratase [Chloroflexota bacterium]